MKESIIQIEENSNQVGIITFPQSEQKIEDYAIVFINAGLINRIGPNGIYVKLARILGNYGFMSVRWDFSHNQSLGPGVHDYTYKETQVSDTRKVLDLINKKTGIDKYILVGLCSGADNAFWTALKDDRVKKLYCINGSFINSNDFNLLYPSLEKSIAQRYYRKNLLSINKWIKTVRNRRVNSKKLMDKLKEATSKINFKEADLHLLDKNLSELKNKNVFIDFIYSEGSLGYELYLNYLKPVLGKVQYSFKLFKNTDHIFTPVSSQNKLIKYICFNIQKTIPKAIK